MRCDILTLFPDMIAPVIGQSILKHAQNKGLLELRVRNFRSFATDKHHTADDHPFGGGAGMVLKAEPILRAVEVIKSEGDPVRVILTTPRGRRFSQHQALDFSREAKRLVFICGHYEGIDERVKDLLDPEEFSIGDYVLTGGELAALVMIDASARFVPGVLGDPSSVKEDSFSEELGFLEYPQYTRPAEFRGLRVPEVLVSGHHDAVRRWRRREALLQTWKNRPDLLNDRDLSYEDERLLEEIQRENMNRWERHPEHHENISSEDSDSRLAPDVSS